MGLFFDPPEVLNAMLRAYYDIISKNYIFTLLPENAGLIRF